MTPAKRLPSAVPEHQRWTPPPTEAAQTRMRLLGDAIVFACAGMQNTTTRHAVTLLCSLDGQALHASTPSTTVAGQVLLIAPMAAKTICALDCPLVLVDIEPAHPRYRHFTRPGTAELQALDTDHCQPLRAMAQAFAAGQLHGQAVDASVRAAVDALAKRQASPGTLDARIRQLMGLLDENPCAELTELAPQVGLSPHHASRLFAQVLGLPLRRYALAVKIRAAASFMGSGLPLTQIAQAAGFVDSAHFSKVWVQCYGAPPSHFFNPAKVHVDQTDQPDWLLWYLAQRDGNLPPPAAGAQSPWVHRQRKLRAPRLRAAGSTAP